MKELQFLAAIIFSFSIFSAAALAQATEDVKSEFDSIKSYASDYESGKISYLQLKIYADSIGEKIRRSVSRGSVQVKGEDFQAEGLSTEAIENILGPSTEITNHVWIVNQNKESSSSKPLPGWRVTIYNGHKIKITANAWPQIFRGTDGDMVFYWMGFEFFFKKEFAIDPQQLAGSMKQQAQSYYQTGQGAEIFARNILTNENILREYLQQNNEDCVNTVQNIVNGEKNEQQKNRISGSLFSGKNIQVKLNAESCADCKDFSWFNINFWIEAFDKSYQLQDSGNLQPSKDAYKNYQTEQLYSEIRKIFTQLKQNAQTYDNTKYASFSNDFTDAKAKLDSVMQALNEKINDWQSSDSDREKMKKDRNERLEKIIDDFVSDKSSENVKQIEFRKKLLSFNETKSFTHCESRYEDCGPGGMCSNSKCVPRDDKECAGPSCFQPPQTQSTQGRVCPAVCVVLWENRNGKCELNQCGSGCGADNQNSFNKKEDCEARFGKVAETNATANAPTTTVAQTNATFSSTTISSTTTTVQATTTSSSTTTTTNSTPTGQFISGYQTVDKEKKIIDQGPPQTSNPEDSCVKKGCKQNQFCNNAQGWCQCAQGFNDCDGDWRNGCESQQQCKPCNPGAECAPSRCEPEWSSGIEKFVCVQEPSRSEETGGFEINGGCSFSQSKEPDAWVSFNGQGEKFESVNNMKNSGQSNSDWCSQELSSSLKERKEIEKSFSSGFMDWFMKDFVAQNPEDFEIYGRSFGNLYKSVVENDRRIAESLACLNRNEWPETDLITQRVETEYGGVYIYEKFVETDQFGKKMRVLSPYMVMNIFPPKEVFKKFMFKDLREGKVGPDEKDKGGPSPAEVAEIKQNKEAYDIIKKIANNFGGDANIIFSVRDNGQDLFKMHMQVNPDIIMQMKPEQNYSGEVDATLSIDFDYFYDMISGMEKGKSVHTESPPWDQQKDIREDINGAAEGIKFFTGIVGGIISGKVTVSPLSAWPAIVSSFGDLLNMMRMGG